MNDHEFEVLREQFKRFLCFGTPRQVQHLIDDIKLAQDFYDNRNSELSEFRKIMENF